MKPLSVFLIALALSSNSIGQKIDDNRIIVTVADTAKLYERTRQAIVNTDFIIREDSNRDTIVTIAEKIWKTTIFVVAKVIIKGNTVEISGARFQICVSSNGHIHTILTPRSAATALVPDFM